MTRPRRQGLRGPGHLSPPMELRPWLLWVVAAAGALVLLAADARAQKVYTNTWAVHIPGGPAVADSLARKHGFLNLGQVGALPACWSMLHCQGVGSARVGVQGPGPWAYLLRAIWVGGMFWVARGMGAVVCPALGLPT